MRLLLWLRDVWNRPFPVPITTNGAPSIATDAPALPYGKELTVRLEDAKGKLIGYVDARLDPTARLPVFIRPRFSERHFELLGTMNDDRNEMFFYREQEYSRTSPMRMRP